MHETLIKRTIWVAECNCNEGKEQDKFRKIFDINPPRDVMCTFCHKWIEPKEESYIGKDKFDKK